MQRGIPHGPGVACIVVGITSQWASRNNRRIVVITKLHRISRKLGHLWWIRPRDGEPGLHGFKEGKVPGVFNYMIMPQHNLIPIGPDDEQATRTEVDTGAFALT